MTLALSAPLTEQQNRELRDWFQQDIDFLEDLYHEGVEKGWAQSERNEQWSAALWQVADSNIRALDAIHAQGYTLPPINPEILRAVRHGSEMVISHLSGQGFYAALNLGRVSDPRWACETGVYLTPELALAALLRDASLLPEKHL